jgi:hypothetical protein
LQLKTTEWISDNKGLLKTTVKTELKHKLTFFRRFVNIGSQILVRGRPVYKQPIDGLAEQCRPQSDKKDQPTICVSHDGRSDLLSAL